MVKIVIFLSEIICAFALKSSQSFSIALSKMGVKLGVVISFILLMTRVDCGSNTRELRSLALSGRLSLFPVIPGIISYLPIIA